MPDGFCLLDYSGLSLKLHILTDTDDAILICVRMKKYNLQKSNELLYSNNC